MHFRGDNSSDATTRIVGVPRPPWNQMKMAVGDRLTSRFASVHTEVEPFDHAVFLAEFLSPHPRQIPNRLEFTPSDLERIHEMPFWDEQRMSFGNRETIPDREC